MYFVIFDYEAPLHKRLTVNNNFIFFILYWKIHLVIYSD